MVDGYATLGCGLGWVGCLNIPWWWFLYMVWNHATLDIRVFCRLKYITIKINFCKPKALVLQIERIAARLHQSSNLKEISSIQFIFEKLSNLGRVSLFTIYIYIYIYSYIYILVYIKVKPNILVKRLGLAPGEPFLNFGRVPQRPTQFDSWRGGILLFYINIYAMAKFIGPAWVL